MPQTYLIFHFGTNEEAAQQARHRIENWRQAFRLGDKMQLRFERTEPDKKNGPETIRLLVRLDFSDHEKLSHQRWVDRIPGEEPFKSAKPEVVRAADASYTETRELFDSLSGERGRRDVRR
jgi:hypothetical protein